MTAEVSEPNPPAKTPARGRPWAGVIFSLFVAGFGIAAATVSVWRRHGFSVLS